MSDTGLQVSVQRAGTTVRVVVAGELDLATAPQLREHVSAQLADHAEIIVLDLAGVSFIDSTGLHALIEASEQDGNRLRVIRTRRSYACSTSPASTAGCRSSTSARAENPRPRAGTDDDD